MGKTAFKGPVYGAKCLLWTFGPYAETRSTGGTTGLYTLNATRTVPGYEDWLITEAYLTTSTNSSVTNGHGIKIKSEGGSSSLPIREYAPGNGSTRAQTLFTFTGPAAGDNSTTWSTNASATADAVEYEGAWVPAGSSLRIVSSGITALGGLQLNVMGYIRFIPSTRAEA